VAERRLRVIRSVVLGLAVMSLAAMALSVLGWLPGSRILNGSGSEVPDRSINATLDLPNLVTLGPIEPLVVTPTGQANLRDPANPPQTPADEWASVILQRALSLLSEPSTPADGLAWWQAREASGLLGTADGSLTLGGATLGVDSERDLALSAVDRANPNHLWPLGSIVIDHGALLLTVSIPDSTGAAQRWLLSSGTPSLALNALVIQAASQDVVLRVAYAPSGGAVAQLVILDSQPNIPASPTAMWTTTAGPSPTSTRTPTATITLTPTRVPEAYLGQIIATKVDPVIDAVVQLDAATTVAFVDRHPLAGILTSTEETPEVDGHPIAASLAQELAFYWLEGDGDTHHVVRFLTAVYTPEGTTRFPDDLIYFQGHRMSEIIYWMVLRAAERGGQLLVAYDDFGARQTVTVIGFQEFHPPED
jgi:hypothetical protein